MRVQVQVARNEWSPSLPGHLHLTPGFVEDFWLGFDLLSSTNREVTALDGWGRHGWGRDGWGRDGWVRTVSDNG